MKACPDREKLITWLALDALEARSAEELRAHLETCPGCRRHLAEISRLVGQIDSAAPMEELPASETFHRQLMVRIKTEASTPRWKTALASLRRVHFSWRVALPTAALLVALLAADLWLAPHPAIRVRPPARVAAQPATVPTVKVVPAPNLANYQQAASQSPEKLDDLLFREGERTGGPAQVYTAAAMSLNF